MPTRLARTGPGGPPPLSSGRRRTATDRIEGGYTSERCFACGREASGARGSWFDARGGLRICVPDSVAWIRRDWP